jgi:hypothetical protein
MSEAGPEGTHSKAGVGPFGGRIAETALGTALTLSVKTNMVINRPTFFCPDDWREDLVMMMKLLALFLLNAIRKMFERARRQLQRIDHARIILEKDQRTRRLLNLPNFAF